MAPTFADGAAVAAGGALGALARWGVGLALKPHTESFPWNTLAVNLAGSLAIGLALGWAAGGRAPGWLHPFVVVGVLGGFTTFSSFSAEVIAMASRGHWGAAAAYVGASLAGGTAFAAAGFALAGRAPA